MAGFTCYGLIDTRKVGSVAQKVFNDIRGRSDLESAKSFLSGMMDTDSALVRMVADPADPEGKAVRMNELVYREAEKRLRMLYDNSALVEKISAEAAEGKRSALPQLETVLKELRSALELNDGTQQDNGGETTPRDMFGGDYDGHMSDVYGSGKTSMERVVEESFMQKIFNAAYFNMMTRMPVDSTPEELNRNIWLMRSELFGQIVGYLKENYSTDEKVMSLRDELFPGAYGERVGGDPYDGFALASGLKIDVENYVSAMRLFYNLVLKDDAFVRKNQECIGQYYNAASRLAIANNEYVKMTALIYGSKAPEVFRTRLKNFLKTKGIEREGHVKRILANAFSGNRLSYEADYVREFLLDGKNADVMDYLSENGINVNMLYERLRRSSMDTRLQASMAYTMLTHFNELLEKCYGKSLTFPQSQKYSTEYNSMTYRYGTDQSKMVRGYNTTDEYDTTKFTPKLITAILEQFAVCDWRTGAYTGRNLAAYELITAFKKLKNYVEKAGENAFGSKELSDLIMDYNSGDTTKNVVRILNMMFSEEEAGRYGRKRLVERLERESAENDLTAQDLNALYTLYREMFDEYDEKSMYNMAVKRQHIISDNNSVGELLSAVVQYIATNEHIAHLGVEMRDETSSGVPALSVKTEYKFNYERKAGMQKINSHIQNVGNEGRVALDKRYGFKIVPGNKGTEYVITLGNGEKISLVADNSKALGLFSGENKTKEQYGRTGGKIGFETPEGFWTSVRNVDLEVLGVKLERMYNENKGAKVNFEDLSEGERRVYEMARLLDDTLGLGLLGDPAKGLGMLEVYRLLYMNRPDKDFKEYMMPLLKFAARALYANTASIEANEGGMELNEYLRSSNEATGSELYRYYESRIAGGGKRSGGQASGLSLVNGLMSFVIVSNYDTSVRDLITARMLMSGNAAISSIRNALGNSIPVNTLFKAGLDTRTVARKTGGSEIYNGAETLVFAGNGAENIKDIYHLADVTNETGGLSKVSADLTMKELVFDMIFNKFYTPYVNSAGDLSDATVIVQACGFADKRTLLNHRVKLSPLFSKLGIGSFGARHLRKGDMLEAIRGSLGRYYSNVFRQSRQRLCMALDKAAEKLESGGSEEEKGRAAEIRSHISGALEKAMGQSLNSEQEAALDRVYDALKLVSEKELSDGAMAAGVKVSELDYKTVDGKKLAANDLLRYYAETFGDKKALESYYAKMETAFLRGMLENEISFKVIEDYDSLDNWSKGSAANETIASKNAVIKTIENWCKKFSANPAEGADRFGKYMGNWVDEESGNLILAKELDMNLPEEYRTSRGRSILTMNDLNSAGTGTIELNPLLSEFVYIESFVRKNLEPFVIGTELNAGTSQAKVFAAAKKAGNADEFSRLGYGEVSGREFEKIRETLDSSFGADDLAREVKKKEAELAAKRDAAENFRAEGETEYADTLAIEISEDEAVLGALRALLENDYESQAATAQINNTKRGQAAVSTMSRVIQGKANGVGEKVKIAVINDELAPVYNTSAGSGTIKSSDGNAEVLSWETIMESNSLGSNSTGYLSKPVIVDYDPDTGTMFYMKFSGNTITNERMRMSEVATTRLRKVFKKMSNMQWVPADGIRLDEYMVTGGNAKANNFFLSIICEGKPLFYRDRSGEIKVIRNLLRADKGEMSGYYYTVEAKQNADGTYDSPKQIYHIFYDGINETGEWEESAHMAVEGKENARKALDSLVAKGYSTHAINSLYELHKALGGIYCVEEDGSWSERNNNAVVNFMGNVGRPKSGKYERGNYVSSSDYDMPLKKYYIGYAANSSAVKKGRWNVNMSQAWSDDSKLNYVEVKTDYIGIQQNSEKDMEDSELSEPSQILASLAAYGYMSKNVSELNRALEKDISASAERLLDNVGNLLKGGMTQSERAAAKSALYDYVGRTVLSYRNRTDLLNMAEEITRGLKSVFDKHFDHADDESKIPLSDPSLYRVFSTDLANMITNSALKRKYPGGGMVMEPAYNRVQYYEVDNLAGGRRKLFSNDILKLAKEAYRSEMIEWLEQTKYAEDHESTASLRIMRTSELERMCLENDIVTGDGEEESGARKFAEESVYYTGATDNEEVNRYLIKKWLSVHSSANPVYDNKEWFMPSDIVDVIRIEDGEEKVVETVDLDSLEKYYAFQDRNYGGNVVYRISSTAPHNLRPATMRWQYKDKNGVTHWTNYFNLPHVREAYLRGDERYLASVNYKARVQQALMDLDKGRFKLNGSDKEYTEVIEGSFENEDAEVVMSAIYAKLFGLESGESLADIMRQGEAYFRNKGSKLYQPGAKNYDIAFLRDDGMHTLLAFGDVDDANARAMEFSNKTVRENGEIVALENGKEQFVIGRYVEDSTVQLVGGKFVSLAGETVSQSRYRVGRSSGKVERRIDFVTPYSVHSVSRKDGLKKSSENRLYKIADRAAFEQAYGAQEADRMFDSVVRSIWRSGNFALAESKSLSQDRLSYDYARYGQERYNEIYGRRVRTLENVREIAGADKTLGELIEAQRRMVVNATGNFIDKSGKLQNAEVLNNVIAADMDKYYGANDISGKLVEKGLKGKWLDERARERWVNFQDSLKVISGRVPAQSLQSFMTMKVVGFTETTSNVAYVSHFQAYLQGSDYDIDKSNMMGQTYNIDGKLVGWSPYFDHRSLEALEASKMLPMPDGMRVSEDSAGADITEEAAIMIENSRLGSDGKMVAETDVDGRNVRFLRALAGALEKIRSAGGKFSAPSLGSNEREMLRKTLQAHEDYANGLSAELLEGMYKNIVFKNTWLVSRDVKNRDYSYTPIETGDVDRLAAASPKGKNSLHNSPFNPLTNLVLQTDNLGIKKVVGTEANAQKFWFNFFQYFTETLKSEYSDQQTLRRLKFDFKLGNVVGRRYGAGKPASFNCIPDLDPTDPVVTERMENIFGMIGHKIMNYKRVENKISQLGNAATDNAKNPVLAKLNCTMEYVRVMNAMVMLGIDWDDAGAFMTSPFADMVVRDVEGNLFDKKYAGYVDPRGSIKSCAGRVNSSAYLKGTVSYGSNDETGSTRPTKKTNVAKDVLVDNLKGKRAEYVAKRLGTSKDMISMESLDDIAQAVVESLSYDPFTGAGGKGKMMSISENFERYDNDSEVTEYLKELDRRVGNMREAALEYAKASGREMDLKEQYEYGTASYMKDYEDFLKLYDLGTEISDITGAFMSFNTQGLPIDDAGIVDKLGKMDNVVKHRERALDIRKARFETSDEAKNKVEYEKVIDRIAENNGNYTREEITLIFDEALDKGIVNGFKSIEMMRDSGYRETVRKYYDIIKGMSNFVDVVYGSPFLRTMVDSFSSYIAAREMTSVKTRLVSEMYRNDVAINEKSAGKISRYADLQLVRAFLADNNTLQLNASQKGFDRMFNETTVDRFELHTRNGAAGFIKYVNEIFVPYLKREYATNGFVKNISADLVDGKYAVKPDIDMLYPFESPASRKAYYEMLTGIRELADKDFWLNEEYSLADVFVLYNMVVNGNEAGRTALTGALIPMLGMEYVEGKSRRNVARRYNDFVGRMDYDESRKLEWSKKDYEIYTAPVVTQVNEKYHTEPYVKTLNLNEGYVLKRKNDRYGGEYIRSDTDIFSSGWIMSESRNAMKRNYMRYSPWDMVNMERQAACRSVLMFEGEAGRDVISDIKFMLKDLYLSGKIGVVINC